MYTFIVGYDNGRVDEMNANDMFWLLSELNQKGNRYNISFIIKKGDEVVLLEYLRKGK